MFRTDSSTSIGYGHVMRCLTLADSLTVAGCKCAFISRSSRGNINKYVQDRGYGNTVLPVSLTEDSYTDGTEANIVAGIVEGFGADWLVVDHYQINSGWESKVRGASNLNILVIDDNADREHDCDILLDQNYGREASDYRGLVPSSSTLLVGLSYALLRPEFSARREQSLSRQKQGRLNHLLITMGGTDELNMSTKVLHALTACYGIEKIKVSVVLGQTSQWIDSIKGLSATLPFALQVHVGISNMAELMADVDVAIGACGSTTWERCCLGVPSLLFVLADNQERICNDLFASEVIMKGEASLVGDSVKKFWLAIKNNEYRQNLVRRSSLLVDGFGAERVSTVLLGAKVGHCDT